MRQISWITIAATLTLLSSGCGLIGGGGETTGEGSPSPSPVAASPSTAASPEAALPSPTASPGSATRTAALPRDLDLIPSTDPDQRVQSIQGNRSDPFSIVPTTPSVEITRTTPPGGTSGATTGGTAPTTGTTGGAAGQPSGGGRQARGSGNPPRPGSLAPIPNLVPGSRTNAPRAATRPVPPPPPQPELARAVQVLGVVQIGGVPYAIVSAPNEPTSRYVREGQRLSNGQVAVRRIEVNGPEPVVVFEQYGVEVVTAVGGGGAPASTTATPAASLPAGNPGQAG